MTPWHPEPPLNPIVVQSQACAECHVEMDMTRVVWWCPGGVVCSEVCARLFTEGPDDGHRFTLTATSKGSWGVVGEEGHTDSELEGPSLTLTVRAWDLPAALRKAADLPLRHWRFER